MTNVLGIVLGISFALLPYEVLALPEDADQPIRILSQEMVYDEKAARAIYRGGVTVHQGTLQITAETVTVQLDDQQVTRVTADGDPAYYSQQLSDGAQLVKADASTIVYHTRDERVDLKGAAHLTQKGNEFRGDIIEYDVRAGRVDGSGATDRPLRMVLQPKRRKAEPTSADKASGGSSDEVSKRGTSASEGNQQF